MLQLTIYFLLFFFFFFSFFFFDSECSDEDDTAIIFQTPWLMNYFNEDATDATTTVTSAPGRSGRDCGEVQPRQLQYCYS